MTNSNENPGELNGSQVQSQQSSDYSVKSIKDLKSLAKEKDPEAMFELGHRYRVGEKCNADSAKAAEWFEKAVDNGFDIIAHKAAGGTDERFTSFLRLYKNHIDDHHWGIQAFDNPQEAWDVVKGEWSKCTFGCNGGGIYILDDAEFEKAILSRAVISLCRKHFGKISKTKCNLNLGLKGKRNDFLVDFNYFLYSETTGRYYTSLMKMKDDYNSFWSDRQWSIYNELWDVYDFDSIIKEAEDFFNTYEFEIDDSGSEDYGGILFDSGYYYIP